MEEKKRIGFWRILAAIALGYLACGITYNLLPIIIAYPVGMLTATTVDPAAALELIKGFSGLASIAVWILVSVKLINGWRKAGKTED